MTALSVQDRVMQRFPGALWLSAAEQACAVSDPHTLFYGERSRLRSLLRFLRRVSASLAASGYAESIQQDVWRRRFHDYFVGDPNDSARTRTAMYRGRPADFDRDHELWRKACGDVEAMYADLLHYIPRRLVLPGKRPRDFHHLVRRPEEVSRTHDPMELFRLLRLRGLDTQVERMRFYARQKLVFAQFCFELRRKEYSPDTLAADARDLEAFVRRNLFPGQQGDRVHIIARLDPAQGFKCADTDGWKIIEHGKRLPKPLATRAVMPAVRYYVHTPGSTERVPLLFLIRPKLHPLLKALLKDIRFFELMGIGDSVAMMFVVESEGLEQVVGAARHVLAPCPGQVCDQGSSIGHRKGTKLDAANVQSSTDYEAMKYVSRQFDRMVEIQFVPMRAWINARCAHNAVNHGLYKLSKYLGTIFPVMFPEALTGIPWSEEALREHCSVHVLEHMRQTFV